MRILCVHGVGGHDLIPEPRKRQWRSEWRRAIFDSRNAAKGNPARPFGATDPSHIFTSDEPSNVLTTPSFQFAAYDDLFTRRVSGWSIRRAVAGLSKDSTGPVYRLLGLLGRRLDPKLRDTVGMVAAWLNSSKIRARCRDRIATYLRDGDFIFAHSLGSLIVYDLLRQRPSLQTSHTLVTFGSQIGNPFTWSALGGKPEPLGGLAKWWHLFNRNDEVFTASLGGRGFANTETFTQLDTQFDDPGLGADHAVRGYLTHEATRGIWR